MSDTDLGTTEFDPVTFKPIQKDLEIVVEGKADEDEDDLNQDPDVTVGDLDDPNEDQDDFDEDEDDPQPKKKLTGANKRIQGLIAENKRLEAERTEAQKLAKEARDRAEEVQKNFVIERKRASEITLTALKNEEITLSKQLEDAGNAGDTGKIIKLTNELGKVQNNIEKLNNYIPKIDEPVKETKTVVETQAPEVKGLKDLPKIGREWLKDNPEFYSDKSFQAKAVSYGRILEIDGYDVESPEYWEELSNKINGDVEDDAEPAPAKRKSRKKKTAPTSQSSRVTRTSKRTSVRLTAEEADMAERLGIAPKDYARGVLDIEDNATPNGYTAIKIGQ